MSPKIDKEIKKVVIARFSALPKNISFSIGDFGDFTRDQLIKEIEKESSVGKAAIEMQINFIKNTVKINKIISEEVAA